MQSIIPKLNAENQSWVQVVVLLLILSPMKTVSCFGVEYIIN